MSQTLTRFTLPVAEVSVNVRALSRHAIERFSGGVSATLTLTNEYAPPVTVRWNGTTLDPSGDYTLVARTITLAHTPVAGDTIEFDGMYKQQNA